MSGTLRVDGAKVRRLRMRLGLSAAALAEKSGLTKSTVLRADHGASVALGTARKLARGLGVEVVDIMAEEPDVEEDDAEKAGRSRAA